MGMGIHSRKELKEREDNINEAFDPGMQHWKTVKCAMRYLRRTKGYMLTYRKSEGLEIIMYSALPPLGLYQTKGVD
ncbi:hypothetical protein CR513_38621, partial [Mucuna pruriens]